MTTASGAGAIGIARMRPGDERAATVTLARAFHNDPLFNFLLPDLLGQAYAELLFMGSLLRDAGRFGEVWTARTKDAVAAVAAWLPPGAYPRGASRETAAYLRDLGSVPRLGRRVPAGMRIEAAIRDAHRRIREPHWYLALLATDPSFQGRGAGSALLSTVLERCDADRLPVYLETQKASNVPWYERHHFEVVEELQPRACPSLWTMWRSPR